MELSFASFFVISEHFLIQTELSNDFNPDFLSDVWTPGPPPHPARCYTTWLLTLEFSSIVPTFLFPWG